VNKVQKQTNSELKSLFVTDVTGIRVNYKRILCHFVLSQTQLMEFIAEQFVIKLDIPLCVPVVSYMTGNVRVFKIGGFHITIVTVEKQKLLLSVSEYF
jgi:hypothetical protein